MQGIKWVRAVLVAVAVGSAGVTVGSAGDPPTWPHEQQARLRQVEDQVVDAQRALFAARQRQGAAAVEDLGKKLKDLQRERIQLIRATKSQLPSE